MTKGISVITGGCGGMGRAIAAELGKETKLLLADRNEQDLLAVKKSLGETGYEVDIFPLDVQDAGRIRALGGYATALGPIRHVVHTFGVSPADTGADEILSINAVAAYHMTNTFYPLLAEGGVMLNFASVAAYTMEPPNEWFDVFDACEAADFPEKLKELVRPFEDDAFICAGIAYCISKRFVIYFSQKNTQRFAARGCRIISVSPGSYLTPMHQKLIDNQPETAAMQLESIPLARWGRPYEIASLVRFLCSPGAGYITGVDILADGGQIAQTFVGQME